VTLESLRKAIGVIPQDTVLFNNTIEYNIAYGDLAASREQVFRASEQANIHETIERMPLRYDTLVGERGMKLSGGEKQRVSIARTVLKNPPILLYDEATSALDSATERRIMVTLNEAFSNRTTIAIAHRLSTIVDADKIIVLGAGRVVEEGSHSELMANPDGVYSSLWRAQQDKGFDAHHTHHRPSPSSPALAKK